MGRIWAPGVGWGGAGQGVARGEGSGGRVLPLHLQGFRSTGAQ